MLLNPRGSQLAIIEPKQNYRDTKGSRLALSSLRPNQKDPYGSRLARTEPYQATRTLGVSACPQSHNQTEKNKKKKQNQTRPELKYSRIWPIIITTIKTQQRIDTNTDTTFLLSKPLSKLYLKPLTDSQITKTIRVWLGIVKPDAFRRVAHLLISSQQTKRWWWAWITAVNNQKRWVVRFLGACGSTQERWVVCECFDGGGEVDGAAVTVFCRWPAAASEGEGWEWRRKYYEYGFRVRDTYVFRKLQGSPYTFHIFIKVAKARTHCVNFINSLPKLLTFIHENC